MKHLYYFKEINDSNLEQSNRDFTILFENENWKIEKANSFDALTEWSKDGNINMDSYKGNFSNIFLNTNNKNDDKMVFDFYRGDFYTLEDDNIDLKETIEDNVELLNYYGENLKCKEIVKDDDDYWLVVKDFPFFSDYFKIGDNTSDNFISTMLSGDAYDLFQYNDSSFSINDNMTLDKENIDIIKVLLTLELINNNIDIDIEDIDNISDYSDIVDIIEEYDMDELKGMLLDCIRSGHEAADEAEAWSDIIGKAYSFFGVSRDSIKWNNYNNSKEPMLWLKFDTKTDAYKAKFIIKKYDDSYQDDVIDYSQPYYGYNGSTKDLNETFNERLSDKISEYNNDGVSGDDISESYNEVILTFC